MTSIRWTTVAADELEVHVKHIREDNPKAARAMAQSILDRLAGEVDLDFTENTLQFARSSGGAGFDVAGDLFAGRLAGGL